MDLNKIKEVLNDKEYVESLLKLETPQQVQESLASKGVDLTVEQINEIKDLIIRYQEDNLTDLEKQELKNVQDGELSDDQLEAVSGGSIVIGLILVGVIAAEVGIVVGLGYLTKNRSW